MQFWEDIFVKFSDRDNTITWVGRAPTTFVLSTTLLIGVLLSFPVCSWVYFDKKIADIYNTNITVGDDKTGKLRNIRLTACENDIQLHTYTNQPWSNQQPMGEKTC